MDLDNLNEIKALDRGNMHGSIELLWEQINQTHQEIESINLPANFASASNIVFAGMGGSALGASVYKELFFDFQKTPFVIVNDYHLPGFTGKDSLVIIQSYSGTTEESISCLEEAIKKTDKIIVIASGGKLEKKAKASHLPFFKIVPTFNPSNQPRMAIGYALFSVILLLKKLSYISLDESEWSDIQEAISKVQNSCGLDIKTPDNPAKTLAITLKERVPFLIAGEFLSGTLQVIRNQMHENAKSLAFHFLLPEMDHHFLEALDFPNWAKKECLFVFFESKFYSPEITKRIETTKQIVKNNGFEIFVYPVEGASKLAQACAAISFGSYVSFYLAMLYQIDPSPIVRVEEFKKIMSGKS